MLYKKGVPPKIWLNLPGPEPLSCPKEAAMVIRWRSRRPPLWGDAGGRLLWRDCRRRGEGPEVPFDVLPPHAHAEGRAINRAATSTADPILRSDRRREGSDDCSAPVNFAEWARTGSRKRCPQPTPWGKTPRTARFDPAIGPLCCPGACPSIRKGHNMLWWQRACCHNISGVDPNSRTGS